MTPLGDIFPHMLSAADIAGPGPSPWVKCSRPSCGLLYRTVLHCRMVTPACPMCSQPYIPSAHGPRLTQAQREAIV